MNKKIYRIDVCHIGPKDSLKSIACFLVAEDEDAVYEWINKTFMYGGWEDINDGDYLEEGEDNTFNIYDKDYIVIGTETYKEKIIRIKGDINDEDYCHDDAYYGLTQYGWEEMEVDFTTFPLVIQSLKGLGILKET